MYLPSTTITRMRRLRTIPPACELDQKPSAYPVCSMRGGLCEVLIESAPIAIMALQFLRDEHDMVQDAMVLIANTHAIRIFGGGEPLVGKRFLQQRQDLLLSGVWQRCLWVAAQGRGETVVEKPQQLGDQPILLAIAPFGDGLLLSCSILLAENDFDVANSHNGDGVQLSPSAA